MPIAPRAKMGGRRWRRRRPARHVVAADLPHAAERDHAERRERGERGDHRRREVEEVDSAGRRALLADELDEVGDRLEEPERPGAVRPVAELHAAEELALEPGRVGEGDHDEVDDDEALMTSIHQGLVPGRHLPSRPARSARPSACSAAIGRAAPQPAAEPRASSLDVPFEPTRPSRRPRSRAPSRRRRRARPRARGAGTGAAGRARRRR